MIGGFSPVMIGLDYSAFPRFRGEIRFCFAVFRVECVKAGFQTQQHPN
jgi:hypothetical protein